MQNHGLGAWLPKRRQTTPNNIAFVYGDDQRMNYAQLADQADAMAALLHQQGVVKGDRVAFIGENCPEFVITMFGCAQLGAIFVPINTRLAPPEIEYILGDSGSTVLVHGPEFAEAITQPTANTGVHHVWNTASDAASAQPGLHQLLADAPHGHLDIAVTHEDPALIMYTSGTTGRPKGAVLSHGNLTWVSINTALDYDVVSGDIALLISPLFHAAALGMGALPLLLKGATMVLEQGFEPGRALELIERHHITYLSGVPTTYQLLADHERWATTDISSLNKLTCGGSAVPTRILDAYQARGLSFSQGYGMTETSPGASYLRPEFSREKQGSVGVGHFFTEVRVTDSETGVVVPPGTIGEIEVRGPNVFSGYFGLPEATENAFTADGWYKSGDLGYLDSDGFLFIADRLKDMIISGGENIYPAEIENHLNSIEGVTGAAVIGVPNEQWGEVGWAVLTVAAGTDPATVSTERVKEMLAARLARYKIPKRVIVIDDFPRTASGKIRKADLRAQFAPTAGA